MTKEHNPDQKKTILEAVVLVDIRETAETDRPLQDPRPGDSCPKCEGGYFDYNGLLNLVCIRCGYTLAGCST